MINDLNSNIDHLSSENTNVNHYGEEKKRNSNFFVNDNIQKKKLKLTSDDGSMGPVEQILSLKNLGDDFFFNLCDDCCEDLNSVNNFTCKKSDFHTCFNKKSCSPLFSHFNIGIMSLNFPNVLNDKIKLYYSKKKNYWIETLILNSSFASLNKNNSIENTDEPQSYISPNSMESNKPPMFSESKFNKNDNSFLSDNNNSNTNIFIEKSNSLEQYLSYDDDDDSILDLKQERSLDFVKSYDKMSFHYRFNQSHLNLSLDKNLDSRNTTNSKSHFFLPSDNGNNHDLNKILSKTSFHTNQTSVMLGACTFIINDFFI